MFWYSPTVLQISRPRKTNNIENNHNTLDLAKLAVHVVRWEGVKWWQEENEWREATNARHMMDKGSGVILNTASTGGSTGYPHYADYNASKGGVIALTRSMALELSPIVRVNAVSPGYVLTPMQRAEYTHAMLGALSQNIPLGRHAKPEEIAALFAFLASEDAAFATGHVYVMDGAETTGGLCSQGVHE